MTLNCNGKILDLSTKKIMGIVNVSNDSFYDGGQYNSIDKVNSLINDLVSDGAEIIDVGAASSKPGSKLINTEEELKIISDYIIEISNNFRNIHLSIDTYNSDVAEFALKKGFSIINDINQSGVSILLVEQNAKRALSFSDRGYVLDQGRNAYQGKGEELLNDSRVVDLYLGKL